MSDPQSIKEPAAAYATVADSAHRLFPDLSLDQVMAELLLERAQKKPDQVSDRGSAFRGQIPAGLRQSTRLCNA